MNNDSILNKRIDSKFIKKAINRMNSNESNDFSYDYGYDYVLNQSSYFIKEIEKILYIYSTEFNDEDDNDEDDNIQKIICPNDNNDYFIALLELEIVKSQSNNYKEVLRHHGL